MFFLAGLIRECADGQKVFVEHDGFSSLLRVLQSPVEKLRVKAAFMLRSLCNEDASYKSDFSRLSIVFFYSFYVLHLNN